MFNPTDMKTIIQVILFSAILLSCNDSEIVWMDSPPIAFQGKFYQVLDDNTSGMEEQVIIEVTNKEFYTSGLKTLTIKENMDMEYTGRGRTYPISRVSQTKYNMQIHCTDPESISGLSEKRFELITGEDSLFHISEIVNTGEGYEY